MIKICNKGFEVVNLECEDRWDYFCIPRSAFCEHRCSGPHSCVPITIDELCNSQSERRKKKEIIHRKPLKRPPAHLIQSGSFYL